MSFDWQQIKQIGLCPAAQFDPTLTPKMIVPKAMNLFVGKTPIPKTNEWALMIDGLAFNLETRTEQFSIKAITDKIKMAENEKKLCLKLDDDSIQFLEFENILNDSQTARFSQWISKNKNHLRDIANEYETNSRQFYHFMYDLLALWKSLDDIPQQYHTNLIETIDAADKLMHNRILAEITVQYIKKGLKVEIEPPNILKSRKPDLGIDDTPVDVKTILTTATNDRESCSDFAHKLSKDIIEKEISKSQLGKTGVFFIAPWSGIINSIFYVFFHKMKIEKKHNYSGAIYYDVIPPFKENQTVFVLTTQNAFENGYLVFDTKLVSKIIEDFVEQGYPMIGAFDPLSYLFFSNIRKGCPLGIQGENPNFVFYIR